MRDPPKRTDEEGRFVENAIQPDMGFPEVGLLDNRNAKELVRNSGVDIRNGEGFVKLILADLPHGENRVRMMQKEPYSGLSSGHLNVSTSLTPDREA